MTPLSACLAAAGPDRARLIAEWLAARLDAVAAEPVERRADAVRALRLEVQQCREDIARRARAVEELRRGNLTLRREKDRRECLTEIADQLRELKYVPGLGDDRPRV